jgi:AAA domain
MQVSERSHKARNNMGVFVCGRTGSGKSRMLQRLASYWKRVLFIDPTGSLHAEIVTTSYDDTVSQLQRRYLREIFSISAVYDNDSEYEKLFAGLVRLIRAGRGKAPPFLLVVDEVDLFSSPGTIEPNLSRLLRYGRHASMSWAVACRADVETHRDVRMNASEVVLFRQGMLSAEMKRILKDAEIVRESDLPVIGRLTPHGPEEPELAEEGKHFVAVPEPFDEWLKQWQEVAKAA